MEPSKIELLIEKYFDAETTVNEENELKIYFSQDNVAPHLLQYQSMFNYFKVSKEQTSALKAFVPNRKNYTRILSIAASVVVLLGVGVFSYHNMNVAQKQDLGNFESPEVAFRETQRALLMLSENVNVGISGAQQMREFDTAKNKIFYK